MSHAISRQHQLRVMRSTGREGKEMRKNPTQTGERSLIADAERIEEMAEGRISFERATWIALYLQRITGGMSHEEAIALEAEEIETRKVAALPADPDGQNEDRARWAEAAILAFELQAGADREDALCDLLEGKAWRT